MYNWFGTPRRLRVAWGLVFTWGVLASACSQDKLSIPVASNAARLDREVNPDRELVITDVMVVNDRSRIHEPCDARAGDPLNVWDFGNQMINLATLSRASDASAFTEQIFQTLEEVQTINGFAVPSRNDLEHNEGVNAKMLNKWRSDSSGGALDLAIAPFRLDAISFRLDLRQKDRQGRVKNAGEGRFVYGFVQRASPFCHDDSEMRSPQFATFIIECKLPATTDAEVLAWANAVHALGDPTVGDYNQALEDLTRQFMAGCMTPDSENSGQLRMNEQTFSDSHSYYHEDTGITERIENFWQFREWKMTEGRMVLSTVRQTPDLSLNNTQLLASFINDNAALVREQTHNVPLIYLGQPFRGGDARNSTVREEDLDEVKYLIPPWNAPNIQENDLRELFAVNTCNGCHHLETGTAFMHVPSRRYDRPTELSRFLKGGITLPDPVDPSISRSFNELARRADDLIALIESGGALSPALSGRPH